jgi:hypothetical protein
MFEPEDQGQAWEAAEIPDGPLTGPGSSVYGCVTVMDGGALSV